MRVARWLAALVVAAGGVTVAIALPDHYVGRYHDYFPGTQGIDHRTPLRLAIIATGFLVSIALVAGPSLLVRLRARVGRTPLNA